MRASDLDMKIDYLRRRNGRRVVTFATATPIANSVTEAYVMQRFLRPDLLRAAGISVFDSWAATFGQVVTQVELAPEGGSSFRLKARFAKFANVPEMVRLWNVFADVKTADDLNLPVPALTPRPGDGERTPETVVVEPSGKLIDYVADLGRRADKVRSAAVSPDEDNMLKISGDGRRAALDLRLVGLPQDVPGKIEAAADRIAATWRAHRHNEYHAPNGAPYPARGSLQIVFCDLGTPSEQWNAYDELRSQLAARGMPRETIRFVHEAKNDAELARLFAACRSGGVAVLVGSTEKAGVGTNVQDRAIALHHLDAPWRPADVAQREGRIIRQGNLNAEVQVIRYVVRQSFDGFSWQTLQRKSAFINQVMRGRLDVREIGDIGDVALSYAEVKALATGNPLLMEQAEADAELSRLRRAERAYHRNQDGLAYAVKRLKGSIESLTRLAATLDAAIARRQDTHGDRFTMVIQARRHAKRADAGQHLASVLAEEMTALTGSLRSESTFGELGGFPLTCEFSHSLGQTIVTLSLAGAPATELQMTATELTAADRTGLITRLENRLHGLEANKARALADIERAHNELAHAHEGIGRSFTQAAQLAAARERSARISKQLAAKASEAAPGSGEAVHETNFEAGQ